MKKLIPGILLLFISSLVLSQTASDYIELTRSVLQTEKKAAIAEVMQLSDTEADLFWPLYNEFNKLLYEVGDREVKIIMEYAKNYDNMTNEKADELWTSYIQVQTDYVKLHKKYYKKFKKILPAGKVAKYFQAENKINTMIDAQLAIEIPMIEIK
jgi:hypothetical protein